MAVRKEKVLLELETNFPLESARAAASLEVIQRQLGGISRQAVVTSRATRTISKDIDDTGAAARRASTDIDRFSGRLVLIGQAIAVLGPGLVPIGAVAIPAVAGLAAQLGFAAIAGGAVIASFQGVGDALKAVNEAAFEPTEANLDKARAAMEKLSPAARDMVRELQDLGPVLRTLRDIGAENLFPGITRGLDGMQNALPRVQAIMEAVTSAAGDIAGDAGESIGSARWAPFLDFLAREAPSALSELAQATGNVAHALGGMWMAFTPLNQDFSGWLVQATADLDRWAAGLSASDDFAAFIDYIRENGPQVAETFGALVDALSGIVQAAAPLGGPVLAAIEGIANALATVAESDLGTPILGMLSALALLNRTMAVTSRLSATTWGAGARGNITGMVGALTHVTSAQERAQMSVAAHADAERKRSEAVRAGLGTIGRSAALMGGLAVASTGMADSFGLSNTASLALMGTIGGPWGAAIGGAAGLLLDLKAASDRSAESARAMDAALESGNLEALRAGAERAKLELDQLVAAQERMADSRQVRGDRDREIVNPSEQEELKKARARVDEFRRATAAAERQAARVAGYRRQAAALRESSTATRETGRSFLDISSFANDAELSLNGFIDRMNQNATALLNFGRNAEKAANRGLRDGLIQQLRELGPEGARRLRQLANATDSQITRANRAYDRGQRALRRYSDTAGSLPKRLITEIEQRGVPQARSQIVDLTRKYNLTPSQVRTLIKESGGRPTRAMVEGIIRESRTLDAMRPTVPIRATNFATGVISAVQRALNGINGTTATTYIRTVRIEERRSVASGTNAYTSGVGGRRKADGGQVYASGDQSRGARDDSIPTLLSHREYVHNVAAVDWYGEQFMADVNARRFPKPIGYADGGPVGTMDALAASNQRALAGIYAAGPRSGTAPVVNLNMTGATVLIDAGELGQLVGEVVAVEMGARDEVDGMLERAGA